MVITMVKKLTVSALVLLLVLVMAVPSVFAASALTAPTEVKQIDASKTSFEVKWTNPLGASVYSKVQYSNDGSNWVDAMTSATTSDSATIYNGVSSGKEYFVRVGSTDSYNGKNFKYSEPIKVCTVPEKVTNLKEYACSANSLNLSWTKSSGATKYKILKYVNNKEVSLGTTTSNKFVLKNLKNTKKIDYDIYVRAMKQVPGYTAQSTYRYDSTYLYSSNLVLVPKKMSAPKITHNWTYLNEANVTCNTVPFAKGYNFEVYNSKNKRIQGVKNTSSSFYAKNIKRTEFYKVRVRAYTEINGKTKFGPWSAYTFFANGTKTQGRSGKHNIKATWNKVSGATNYSVFISKNSETGFKKVTTTKGTSCNITKFGKKALTANTKYYFYVQANKKVGKKTFKSGGIDIMYAYTLK